MFSRDVKIVADLVPHKGVKQDNAVASLVQTGLATPPSKKIRKALMTILQLPEHTG